MLGPWSTWGGEKLVVRAAPSKRSVARTYGIGTIAAVAGAGRFTASSSRPRSESARTESAGTARAAGRVAGAAKTVGGTTRAARTQARAKTFTATLPVSNKGP